MQPLRRPRSPAPRLYLSPTNALTSTSNNGHFASFHSVPRSQNLQVTSSESSFYFYRVLTFELQRLRQRPASSAVAIMAWTAANRPLRPLRISPRNAAAPTNPQENGIDMQQNQSEVQRMSPGPNGWNEPPLRAPQPSFMDHKLERQGVLEQMVPLGTFPTTKVKARAKGNPARKVVQARNLEGMVVDDGLATPEVSTYFASAAEARESSFVATDDDGPVVEPAIEPQRRKRETRSTSQAATASSNSAQSKSQPNNHQPNGTDMPSRYVPIAPSHSTGNSVWDDSFEKALHHSQLTGDVDTEYCLTQVCMLMEDDQEFRRLMRLATHNNSLNERGSALRQRIRDLRSQLTKQGFLEPRPRSKLAGLLSHLILCGASSKLNEQ